MNTQSKTETVRIGKEKTFALKNMTFKGTIDVAANIKCTFLELPSFILFLNDLNLFFFLGILSLKK